MMSPREFFRLWVEGIKALTPKQLLVSKIICTGTMLAGLAWAIVVLVLVRSWHYLVVICAVFGIQVISLIGLFKQLWYMKEIRESVKSQDANLQKILEEMKGDDKDGQGEDC